MISSLTNIFFLKQTAQSLNHTSLDQHKAALSMGTAGIFKIAPLNPKIMGDSLTPLLFFTPMPFINPFQPHVFSPISLALKYHPVKRRSQLWEGRILQILTLGRDFRPQFPIPTPFQNHQKGIATGFSRLHQPNCRTGIDGTTCFSSN